MIKKIHSITIKLILPLFLCSLLITGCVGKKGFDGSSIRYQKVEIPDYEISDYENLLNSENDEIKYNAICNLIPIAWDYARVFKKANAKASTPKEKKPTEKEIQTANLVLDAILLQLNSKNENIKAASLIFLTEFSLEYPDKEMLIKAVEKIQAKSLRTQYEQIRALIQLSDSKTKIDKNLLEKYLNSKSWLISSMTYMLLGKISSEDLHKNLMDKYNNSDKEYNKLLIMKAFSNAYDSETFFFLKNEILSSDSKRVSKKAISILNKNNDKTQVANWIVSDHKSIDKVILKSILDKYYPELISETGSIFFNHLISSDQKELINMIDKEQFFKGLYDAIKIQPQENRLLSLEKKVENIDSFNQAWLYFKGQMGKKELKEQEKKKREKEFEKTVLPLYSLMLETFLEDTKTLFTEAGMDKDEVDTATKEIKGLLQLINKE